MSTPLAHPGEVVIDLNAIADNVTALKSRARSAGLMAVVKADAYGHGLVPSARAALRGGADWLGVAQIGEGLALRAAGVTDPILAWMVTPGLDLAPVVGADVTIAVSSTLILDDVVAAARQHGTAAQVHLKADTGLGRNGAFSLRASGAGIDAKTDWDDLVAAAAAAEAEGAVEVTGIFSHFAYADEPEHPTVRAQEEAFADAVRAAERAGLRPQLRHLSNSAATLTNPGSAWDMVRPGLSVYGLSPVPQVGSAADFGLVPAMQVNARVAVTKDVPAGQGVSYGHTYHAGGPTRLADIPLGYADGIPRHASNAAPVWVAGRRQRIAGRVCMDQFVVDVGDSPVVAGDPVVLFGSGSHGEPTAQDWADAAGTISYEIVTRMGPRVPRTYLGEGVEAPTRTRPWENGQATIGRPAIGTDHRQEPKGEPAS